MTEKINEEKPENENKWIYNHEVRKAEKKNIAFYNGQTFIY